MDSEQLSFLFGGSAKPKLAKEKVNVRKEKEKALAWAANEQKRYDLQVLKQDLTSQIQTTVNNIKKEQRYIVGEEQRQIRRLDKVDQFHSSLQLQKKQLEKKDVVAREFYEETEAIGCNRKSVKYLMEPKVFGEPAGPLGPVKHSS